ncbi:MAG: SH3 domain-containing protein [Fusobacteria bacterium]|nr:SH3 domain-containing protein [Fusobacteriota bacterium]
MKKIISLITVTLLSLYVFASNTSLNGSLPDILLLPQDANFYVNSTEPLQSKVAQAQDIQNYFSQLYSVWNEQYSDFNLSTLNSWYDYFIKSPGVGENLSPISPSIFKKIKNSTESGSFGQLMLPAMVINTSNLRLAPTVIPSYGDATSTPFDHLQCTVIYYGTPIMIIGETKDKSWYFVESGMQADGWIPASDIAFVSKEQAAKLENWNKYMTFSRDDVPIYGQNNTVVAQGKIGMVMPLISENGKYNVLGYGKDNATGNLELLPLKINCTDGHNFPYIMSEANVAYFINQMLGKSYGWGGSFGFRDCSLTQKDLMSQFGIFLNRNSGNLLSCGQVISLTDLTNEQKLKVISLEGIPFRTLLIMNGHVMLYIGQYNEKAIMFHQYWGGQVLTSSGKINYKEKQAEITFVNLGVQDPATDRSTILTALNAMVVLGN